MSRTVLHNFTDEEDGEECDTYYCGRCEKEYKSLGSFLLHTESQEHKLNKKNLKETKTYNLPTNALVSNHALVVELVSCDTML